MPGLDDSPSARKSPKKSRKPSAGTPTLENERLAGYPALAVAGVDEVGRGCLAGPVHAGAVLLPPDVSFERDPWLLEIRDSKLLTAEARERLAPKIEAWAASFAVARVDAPDIDRLNIYHAAHEAMRLAVARLGQQPGHVLVDGNRVPKGIRIASTAVIKGDLKCLSIAAASILAKVARDAEMRELDSRYPGYAFGVHKGYPTPVHLEALGRLGPSPAHRRSFGPVAKLTAPV